jgi:REP element-mobilizing transposase RayT
MNLYDKYIPKIADTYAWCLMKNHFHFLVKIKEIDEIDFISKSNKKYNPSRQFAHLFNSYAQAINNELNRTGGLFENPFERKRINDDKYFTELVAYIHNNPIHHGIVENPEDYKWSSYITILSNKPTKLKRTELLEWFDGVQNFKSYHLLKRDYTLIQNLILE